MEVKVKIGVSNRHIHLNEETYNMLFDEPINVMKPLSQTGEFVSDKVVTLRQNGVEMANVKLLGPLRKYNQVEISHKDALGFKIEPPVRASSNLDGAAEIEVITPKANIVLPACIIAQRHVHMNREKASELGVNNGDKLQLKVDGDKSGIMDVYVKISDAGVFEVHVDTDDANAFLLKMTDEGTLII